MTTAGGERATPAPARPIALPVVAHGGMLGAMVLAMRPGASALDQLAALALLVLLGLLIAPFARARAHLVTALLDLAAMGAMLLAMVGMSPASGGHAHGGGTGAIAAAAVIGVWLLVRMPLTRTAPERVLATFTALSLIAMPVLDAVR